MSWSLEDERFRNVIHTEYGPGFAMKWPDFTEFTPWFLLRSRRSHPIAGELGSSTSYPVSAFCGVYLVAVFDGAPPSGPADPFIEEVAYIGRTRSRTLGSRWSAFARAATNLRGSHSGGTSFHYARVAPAASPEVVLENTYLAALPVWFRPPQPDTSFRTAVIEALLVDSVHHHRRKSEWPPLLNKP